MLRAISLACFIFVWASAELCRAEEHPSDEFIAAHADGAWAAAMQIWEWAEPGYREEKSSALLAGLLEHAGFKIERAVAGIPTAFTATFGKGGPVIGILGEFDALPGLAQQVLPTRAPKPGELYGHACGHHLFGVGSTLAAMAVADRIKAGELSGTVRFYGTPAEEGGSAKVFMAREGLFKDCDAVLHWHPGSANSFGDPTNLARIAVKFRFHGKSAHAAAAPEQGRSALDAIELTNHAAELLREHTPEETRIHHVITAGGDAPNVVPNFGEVFYYIRHPDVIVLRELYDRLVLCAQAGALATETRLEIEYLGGTHNLLPNDVLSEVTKANMRSLLDLEWTEEEKAFASKIQRTLAAPRALDTVYDIRDNSGSTSKGSTDVGDVSWSTPTTGFSTVCWAPGTPAHSWQATACGATTFARKGMLAASRVLAATAADLLNDPELLGRAREELNSRLDGHAYQSLLNPDQAPPLDYRDPPKTQ